MDKLELHYEGKDGVNRPVYRSGERLFVDTEPRKDREPNICTVLNNVMGGEPDTPIAYIGKYKEAELLFIPERVTW